MLLMCKISSRVWCRYLPLRSALLLKFLSGLFPFLSPVLVNVIDEAASLKLHIFLKCILGERSRYDEQHEQHLQLLLNIVNVGAPTGMIPTVASAQTAQL